MMSWLDRRLPDNIVIVNALSVFVNAKGRDLVAVIINVKLHCLIIPSCKCGGTFSVLCWSSWQLR